MSSPNPAEGPPAARAPVDEDDHDVLTFGEVGERLRLEVAAAADAVTAAEASGSAADLDKAQSRLAALRAAATRNSAQPINDTNFERFFGYPGRAKRNLCLLYTSPSPRDRS